MAAGSGPTRMRETEAWRDLAQHDQGAAQADVAAEQQSKVRDSGDAVAAIEDIRDRYAKAGWPERVAEAEEVLAVAREDHAAAVAGVDYRVLAEMGDQSVATPERAAAYWDCGYTETHTEQLAAAEREANREAGQ